MESAPAVGYKRGRIAPESGEKMPELCTERGRLKIDCMPFTAIPHNSRLFLDFLFHFERVQAFYAHRPHASAVLEHARTLQFPAERRARVAAVLERQNRAWGASEATLDSIERFRRGAVACISGQQVGLLGGPLYSLLKAVSALQMADELTAQGCPAVPLFWLATEDHDLAEIASATLPSGCELEKLTAAEQTDSEAPVGRVQLGSRIAEVVERAAGLLGPGWASDALRESYGAGESYGSAFARLFTRLLAGSGLVLVDPLDDELHAIAEPLFAAAASRAGELNQSLIERGQALHRAGYHEQVRVAPDSTLLFSLEGNRRTVLHRAIADAGQGEADFLIGTHRVARQELLGRIADAPAQFSANVLLRPVMQDYLFPTAMYFAGPSEIAYFAQAGVVYEKLLGRSTPVLPRLSATLISPEMSELMERYELSFCDLFHGSQQVSELLASRALAPELRESLRQARESLESHLQSVQAELHKLDPTLADAAARSQRKMQYQLSKIGSKAARAELRRSQALARDACRVLTELFPHKELQERVLPGIYFLAHYGPELISKLKQAAAHPCPGHQIVRL
jgi:bacillithiol biosynthesis cysteine-adding enzyme BshC